MSTKPMFDEDAVLEQAALLCFGDKSAVAAVSFNFVKLARWQFNQLQSELIEKPATDQEAMLRAELKGVNGALAFAKENYSYYIGQKDQQIASLNAEIEKLKDLMAGKDMIKKIYKRIGTKWIHQSRHWKEELKAERKKNARLRAAFEKQINEDNGGDLSWREIAIEAIREPGDGVS